MIGMAQSLTRVRYGFIYVLVLAGVLMASGCATTAGLRPQDDNGEPGHRDGVSVVYRHPKQVVFAHALDAAKQLGLDIDETGPNESYFIAQRQVLVANIPVPGPGELVGVYFGEESPTATMVTIDSRRKLAANVFAKDFSQSLHDAISQTLAELSTPSPGASPSPTIRSKSSDPSRSHYRLTVKATPPDSVIRIMNIVPQYRPGIPLRPGSYDVLVTRPGYQPYRTWVEVRDRDYTFDVALERKAPEPKTDETPPSIVVLEPDAAREQPVAAAATTVRGLVFDADGVSEVTLNGQRTQLQADGTLTMEVELHPGANQIAITATDAHRNVGRKTFMIHRKSAVASQLRRALVIGNAEYTTAPLRNPARDASGIADALKRLDFEVELLRDATHAEMEQAIESFSRQLRRGGVGLFYYAGHGMQLKGQNYLIPVDAQLQSETDIKYKTVHADWVLERMEDAGNELNMVILDACRDNPFARSWRSSRKGLAVMQAAQGALIAYATEPGGVALDGSANNGIYTKHLLQNIEEPSLSVEQLFKQVRKGVFEETGGKQIPWETSSLTGDFYFVPRVPATK